ncbi:hypothetical protein AB0J83_40005 [Actinoplanes sp. NPDC049596]|uniref:hypothetical protein n=1 Tax=unclassified Actinoplanes TaxID=2626549 RepID=UPI003419BE20
MNDTDFRTAPITLDRRLTLGDTDYQVTTYPTETERFDLCIVSSDHDGNVVSEISADIVPSDLAGLTDVLTSTLAGLLAMTHPGPGARDAPPPDRRNRHPNQGVRWTPADDERLLTRYREGARPRDLMAEFGRSNGGIRARLELLGELTPGARWPSPGTPASSTRRHFPADPTPSPTIVPPTTAPAETTTLPTAETTTLPTAETTTLPTAGTTAALPTAAAPVALPTAETNTVLPARDAAATLPARDGVADLRAGEATM